MSISIQSILASIILGLILTACSGSTSNNADQSADRTLIYVLARDVKGIDPHINDSFDSGIILRQIYDTLVYRDPETYEIVPGLASGWTISDDGLVYTFQLRKDVTFHDGSRFTAHAVAANIERIFAAETSSPEIRAMLGNVTQYQVLDEYIIQFTLAEPYAALLDALSQPFFGIAHPDTFNAYSYLRYQYHQVGTGPFRLIEYLPGDRVVVERNPDYMWAPAFYVMPANNAVQRIEFRFVDDSDERFASLQAGQSHIVSELTPIEARSLVGNPSLQILPVDLPGASLSLYINIDQSPTDSPAFRQALLFAVNRSALVDGAYQGFSSIAWGPLSPSTAFYTRRVVGAYSYDIDQAQQLLESSGYMDTDGDNLLDFGGIPVEITLAIPPQRQFPQFADMLQEQWSFLGITTRIESVPGQTRLAEVASGGTYNLIAVDTFGIDPVFMSDLYNSTSEENYTGLADNETDTLLRQAATQSDENIRAQTYSQIQVRLMNAGLILPIADPVNIHAYSIDVEGLRYDATGWYPIIYELSWGATTQE